MTRIKIAINGFGRIGRNAFKIAWERSDIEVVAINDPADMPTLAYLLKHDSVYGEYGNEVVCKAANNSGDQQVLEVNHKPIRFTRHLDAADADWATAGVDVVLDCSGQYTTKAMAVAHIKAGAKRVVISAPYDERQSQADGSSENQERTENLIILGANDEKMHQVADIVSAASCTSNCAAVVASVVERNFGVSSLMISTTHSYTSSQKLTDAPGESFRLSRAAADNIIPSKSHSAGAVESALPTLKGKVTSLSVRVPASIVSLAQLTFVTKTEVSVEAVNQAFSVASNDPYYQGILSVSSEPLVSSDYIGNSNSATVDSELTEVIGGNMVRVAAWYDNEWGYSNRLVELAADVERVGKK